MDSGKALVKKEEPYDMGYESHSHNFAMDEKDQKDVKVKIESVNVKSEPYDFVVPSPINVPPNWTEQEAYLALKTEVKMGYSKEVINVQFPDPVITPDFIKNIHPSIKMVMPCSKLAPRSCNVVLKPSTLFKLILIFLCFEKDNKKSLKAVDNIRMCNSSLDVKKRFIRPNNKYIDTSSVNPQMLKVFHIKDMYEMPHVERAFQPGSIEMTKKSRKHKLVAIVRFKSVYEAIYALDMLVERNYMVNNHKVTACFMRNRAKNDLASVINMSNLKIEHAADSNDVSSSNNAIVDKKPIKVELLKVKKEELME